MADDTYGVKLEAEGADQFQKAVENSGKAVERMGLAFDEVSGRWRTSTGQFASDAERAAAGVENMSQRSQSSVNTMQAAITGAFTAIGNVALEAFGRALQAVGDFVGGSIDIAANFQQGMSVLGAASGATAEEMAELRQTSIDLGNDLTLPATSAVDAAGAMTELVKAGLSVDATMNAAKGTLQLAAAAQIDEAEAAAITANALNTFHLEGDQAVKIADMLAAGANASSASITDLSQGFQQAGFAFEANNQSADDLVTSLALLTNVGLSGSDAGTALKNAMIKLAAPTKDGAAAMEALGINVFDAEGKMKPMNEVIGIFNTAMGGMTEEQKVATLNTILLSDGMKAFLPLMDAGVDGFDAMAKKVNEQGAAAKMAGAQTDGFKGAQMALQSQLETLQLVIGERLLPILTTLFRDVISPAINTVMAMVDAFFAAGGGADQLGAALAPVIAIVESVIKAFQGVATSGESFGVVQAIIASFSGYIQQVFGFISTFLEEHSDEILGFLQGAWEKISTIIGLAVELISGIITKIFNFLADFIKEHGDKIQAFLKAAWDVITTIINTALAIIESIIRIALAAINGDWKTVWTEIENLAQTVWDAITKLIDQAIELVKKTLDLALAFIVKLFADAWDKLIRGIESDWAKIRGAIDGKLGDIKRAAEGVVNDIVGFFNTLPAKLSQAASNAMQALIDGLNARLGDIRGAIQSILDAIANIDLNPFDNYNTSRMRIIRPPATSGQITAGAGAGSGNTNNFARNYNLTLNSMQSSAGVMNDFAIMEALAS